MQDPKLKLKKMRPVVRARKVMLDRESAILARIRESKVAKVSELRDRQASYLGGIDQINGERAKGTMSLLETLEAGVTKAKDDWYQCLRELREIEEKERQQLAETLDARKDLKAVEKLEERYQDESVIADNRKEQKELDEIALRKSRV